MDVGGSPPAAAAVELQFCWTRHVTRACSRVFSSHVQGECQLEARLACVTSCVSYRCSFELLVLFPLLQSKACWAPPLDTCSPRLNVSPFNNLVCGIAPCRAVLQEFQEEAALWEERLTKLNAVLDAWVDVQRRWLYLEGIFFASRDIKQQLPSEFAVRAVKSLPILPCMVCCLPGYPTALVWPSDCSGGAVDCCTWPIDCPLPHGVLTTL